MKLNLPALLMFFGGVLLIYSGYKGEDPRDIINATLFPNSNLQAGQAAGKAAQAIPKALGSSGTTVNTPGVTVTSV